MLGPDLRKGVFPDDGPAVAKWVFASLSVCAVLAVLVWALI